MQLFLPLFQMQALNAAVARTSSRRPWHLCAEVARLPLLLASGNQSTPAARPLTLHSLKTYLSFELIFDQVLQ
jgi:hypothetical protein